MTDVADELMIGLSAYAYPKAIIDGIVRTVRYVSANTVAIAKIVARVAATKLSIPLTIGRAICTITVHHEIPRATDTFLTIKVIVRTSTLRNNLRGTVASGTI